MKILKDNYSQFIILLILLTTVSCSAQQQSSKNISVEEAFGHVNNPSVLWLDIREKSEFLTLPKLSFAKHLPLSTFQASFQALDIPKDQTIFIICRSGNRSLRLQSFLLQEGYPNTVNILGGMKAWVKMKQSTN